MKTKQDIQELIDDLQGNQPEHWVTDKGKEYDKRAFKRNKAKWKKELDRLLNIKSYIERVDADGIIVTRNRIAAKLSVINERWSEEFEGLRAQNKSALSIKNAKNQHEKIYDAKKLRKQLKEMDFICEQ